MSQAEVEIRKVSNKPSLLWFTASTRALDRNSVMEGLRKNAPAQTFAKINPKVFAMKFLSGGYSMAQKFDGSSRQPTIFSEKEHKCRIKDFKK